MNRQERKAVDKQAKQSIALIKKHLAFLNAAGNPKYELKKIYPLKQRVKDMFRKDS